LSDELSSAYNETNKNKELNKKFIMKINTELKLKKKKSLSKFVFHIKIFSIARFLFNYIPSAYL
jgi:hypothetical protein